MEEESLQIIKDKFTKDNGRMEQNMVKDFGKVSEDKLTWVNGKMANPTDMGFLWTKMVIGIKESSEIP